MKAQKNAYFSTSLIYYTHLLSLISTDKPLKKIQLKAPKRHKKSKLM